MGSGVLETTVGERLGDESEEAGITGMGCPRAALISASKVRVVSWKSGSTETMSSHSRRNSKNKEKKKRDTHRITHRLHQR